MHKRISLKSLRAAADGIVADDGAKSIGAADTDARIHTFPPNTGQVSLAVAVLDALGPAVGRVAHVTILAGADAGAVQDALTAVGAALVVAARVRLRSCRWGRKNDERLLPSINESKC